MRPLVDMDVIQIEITNACIHQCSNCTRLVGHARNPFFMEIDFFKNAVDSLIDYPKMIGIMGGEPLLHPRFPEIAHYLKSKVPDKMRCGLWTTLPAGKAQYAEIIADVFGNVLLNDHTLGNLYHSPILVAAREVVKSEFQMWYLIDHCWIQNCWSASINPKGAFFCEVAAAHDVVFEGVGGWPVSPGWWKKTPKDYVEQMKRYCVHCSAALPLHARIDTEETDDISRGNLERLLNVGSPKIKRGKYSIYNKGIRDRNYHINEFRNNIEYSEKIADKYGLILKHNKLGYLQPFLKKRHTYHDTINIKDYLQEAHSYHHSGNLKEASDLYEKILEQQPENINANFLFGTLNLQQGNLDKAAELLEKAVLLKPDHGEAHNNLGIVFQKQGKLDLAMKSCIQALSHAPDYADALYNLGNIFKKQHKYEKALEYYKQVISLKPDDYTVYLLIGDMLKELGNYEDAENNYRRSTLLKPDYPLAHSRLGTLLHKEGKFEEAVQSLKHAIALDQSHAEVHNNLGTALSQLGNYDEAIKHYRRALTLKPDEYQIYSNLASALKASGSGAEALNCCNKAITLNPHYAEAHNNLGTILQDSGLYEKAVLSYKKARALNPDNPEVHSNLGSALKELGIHDEAIQCCERAISLNPDYAEAYNNLGTILHEKNKFEEAIANYKQAIKIKPDHARAHSNLGAAFQEQGKTDQAVLCCQQAIILDPERAELHNNLGAVLHKQERISEAITSYEKALELDPDYAEAHVNRSFALLMTGNYTEGWKENEWRLRTKTHRLRNSVKPKWDGSPLMGKTILVHSEQGFGDTIQFVRYLPMVKAQGGQVILECPRSLHRLLRHCPGIDRIVDRTPESDITYDTHLPLLSLPGVFGTTLDSIPSDTPYLTVNPGLKKLWSARLGNTTEYKIGIVWAGNPQNRKDHIRSCKLADFYPLLEIPGTAFYSLQKGETSLEAKNKPGEMRITDLSNYLKDFADTAAVIANLDLIISVDTAVIHLAGALGKPVWALLHFAPDWRWMFNRNDSPWYPTMLLFRQTKAHNWTNVFKQVKQALLQKVNEPGILISVNNERKLQQSSHHC